MNQTLFQIGAEMEALSDLLEASGGQMTPELEAAFTEVEANLQEKIDSYSALIRLRESEAAICKAESKRFSDRQRVAENVVKRLKERMLFFLQARGGAPIRTERNTFSVRASGGKQPLVITDKDALPDRYIQMVEEVDMERLREDLEAGECIPGAELGTRGVHLQLK